MKLGLYDEYIDAKDLSGLPSDLSVLRVGDVISNPQGEFLYYQGNNQFLFANHQVGAYLVNPDGPWYSLSSVRPLDLTDSRPPMQKIKEWLSSNF